MKSKIITHGGITIDIASVKNFKVQTFSEVGKSNALTVEHKSRIEFVFNPETESYEKVKYNDITEVEYFSYESACAYRDEWEGIWQDCLDEEI